MSSVSMWSVMSSRTAGNAPDFVHHRAVDDGDGVQAVGVATVRGRTPLAGHAEQQGQGKKENFLHA